MSPLTECPHRVGARVAGVYRVVAVQPGRCPRDGRASIRLRIAAGSATHLCGGYQDELDVAPDALRPNSLVAILGRVECTPGARVYIRLTHCRPVSTAGRPRWQLLPRAWVPAGKGPTFKRLLRLLDRLGPPHLRAFMDGVLADAALARRFLTVPARPADPQPGSLLDVSVSRAEKAERIAPRLLLSEDEVGLAIVGALLLEIGETQRPDAGNVESDQALKFQAFCINALAAPLSAARFNRAPWVLDLCRILAPALVAEYTREPPALVADLVRSLDVLTTGAELASAQRSIRTSKGDHLARVLLPGPWRAT